MQLIELQSQPIEKNSIRCRLRTRSPELWYTLVTLQAHNVTGASHPATTHRAVQMSERP